jgi:multicomponent Na+:H+ antiporter subunit G
VAAVLDAMSWVLLLGGGFFVLVGSIGLVRFPEFFTRIHAASITDTLGAGLIILGLLLQSPHWLISAKLVLIVLFLLATGPTATHALAKAALHGGLRPSGERRENGPDAAASGGTMQGGDGPSSS